MEFSDIVVKESPGLCRCCLSEGCYKDLSSEYIWMNENEVYADMLLECFDISITQQSDGPNGSSRLICEVCITRLRDACNFKKQVLDSEKKFIDMIGRGEFRPKILIYQAPMKKEDDGELQLHEVEYLDEEADFDDNEEVLQVSQTGLDEATSAHGTVTAETLTLKRKLAKPRKGKVGRAKKQNTVDAEEKPRSSKAVSKGAKANSADVEDTLSKSSITATKRNRLMKKNALTILQNSTMLPFKWQLKYFLCFYCHFQFKNIEELNEHTKEKHKNSNLKSAVSYLKRDDKVKVNINDLSCKICADSFSDLDLFIEHLKVAHDKKFTDNLDYGVVPYRITKDNYKCGACDEVFQYFVKLNQHMNVHYGKYVCEECGKAYLSYDRLRAHHLMHGSKFRCHFCEDTFVSLIKRNVHEAKVHNSKKSINCVYCNEAFGSYIERKKHYSSVHKIDVTVYSCPVCYKQYQNRSRMETHLREVHIKERKLNCTVCDFKFFSRTHLRKHMIRHDGQRVYQCEICKKSYARKQTLTDHMKIHASTGKHVCSICNVTFTKYVSLKTHIKANHSEDIF